MLFNCPKKYLFDNKKINIDKNNDYLSNKT